MHVLIEPYRQQIAELCQRFSVRRLELFGSALPDDFDPVRSDLDFLVEFDSETDVNLFEAYFDLRQALAKLLKRPVDLVMPSAIRNPYVRAGIEAHRALERPTELFVRR
jgi:predicted nucleotidyltransferase